MKIARQLARIAMLTALPAAAAWAQESYRGAVTRQVILPPEMVLELARSDDDAVGTQAADDAAATADDAGSDDHQAAAGSAGSCQSPGGPCCCGTAGSGCCCAPAPAPWTLPQPCCLQSHGIKLGGWLAQGITFNAVDPADGFNGPVATNDFDGEYQMNQFWMFVDRPVKTDGCGWDLGGHIDMIYGTDWRFGINYGLEDRINGFNDQTYGLVIPQAYVEIAYNDLSVKLGHFAGILDYEVVPAPPNPFYSHSLCYGYTVPQLVTGALADYKLTEQFSIQSGFTRGWFMFEDINDDLDYMGGVKWTSADQRTVLRYAVNTGAQDPAGDNNRFVYSLVAQRKLTERFEYILVHNLGVENDFLQKEGQDAEWYGLNQYFRYTINPRWQANVRIEWLRDDDGARVAGPGNIPGVRAWDGFGFAGNFYELTLGAIWRPHPNLIARPEVRWDWYKGLPNPNGELPYDGGNQDDQFVVGGDLIFTF